MSKFSTKRVDSLTPGDRIVHEHWGPGSVRRVIAEHAIDGRFYYVVSGREDGGEPAVIPRDHVRSGQWLLVVPEPRKVKFMLWHRETDGSWVGYKPDDDRSYMRSVGYILVECEGTEVLS